MDPIVVPAAVLSVTSVLNNLLSSAKTTKEFVKQTSDLELIAQITDLYSAILDVKEKVLDLDAENRSLRAELSQKANVKRTSEFGYFFVEGDPDPHCPKCWEGSGKLGHLSASKPFSNGIVRNCLLCGEKYWERKGSSSSFQVTGGRNNWMG
jgi:hypothetical protein